MASTLNVLLCAIVATLLWACIGLPIARRVVPGPLALPMAPALGWAVHSAAMLPILSLIGMSRTTVWVLTGLSVLAAIAALVAQRSTEPETPVVRIPAWVWAAAALLALAPAAAILPKVSADTVALAAPIFDHSKVAMIDEMARLGVPPGNPFFGETGVGMRLSYYYLWHFGAAELVLLAGVSGWEADAGLTWFTAFASLALMMGLAVWLGGHASSALWVIMLAATASMRPILAWIFGDETVHSILEWATGLGGWLFQVSWAPQHVASASCAVLSIVLIARLAQRRSLLIAAAFVLVTVAAFQSSIWVGGLILPIAAAAAGLVMLRPMASGERRTFALWGTLAAFLALGLALPFLYDQSVTAVARDFGSPIALRPYSVFHRDIPDALRRMLDIPGYWILLLPMEFPAFYVAGMVVLTGFIGNRTFAPDRRRIALALAALAIVSLSVAWLLASTISDNNDLGWRAVLPGVMLLIVFAAVGLPRWLSTKSRLLSAAAIGAVLLGLPHGAMLVYGNAIAEPNTAAKAFANTPAMWEAVRKHSDPAERVGNNPLFLRELTPWPINISWSLLSNRRSCYAGHHLAVPFAPLPAARREQVDAQFLRVFAGNAAPDDIRELAQTYSCHLIVIAAQDGAWTRDPFAASPFYNLVETNPAWRIYKAASPR